MVAERIEQTYNELDAAQEMASWFGDYLLGVTGEIGELSAIGRNRLYGLLGEGDPAEQLTILAELFDQFNEDEQIALALYVCGYPENALEVLSDTNTIDLVARLDMILIPFWTERIEVREKQATEELSNIDSDPNQYQLKVVLGRFSTDLTIRGDWRKQVICRFEDPELFFPIGDTGPAILQAEEAKFVCNRCPVKNNCLEHALDAGYVGVWGATTAGERRQIRRKHGLTFIENTYDE